MTLREVAAELELSVLTLMAAHRAYRNSGWAAVKVAALGCKPGEGRQLSAEQETQIRRLFCEKTPDRLKLGCALWNR